MVNCIDCIFFSTFDEFGNGACRYFEKNFGPDFTCGHGKVDNRTLIPYEKHLGHGSVLSEETMKDIYLYSSIHDEWQKYNDNSGEFKDSVYYTYNPKIVLDLMNAGYARFERLEENYEEVKYFFILRRNY